MACVRESLRLASLGIASVSVDFSVDDNGSKLLRFATSWRSSTPGTRSSHVFDGYNGLAALTGKVSDLYVVDVDVKDGGMEAWCYLTGTRFHPLPDDTPVVLTRSGGMHLYFGLDASLEAGLIDPSSKARIKYMGEPMGIDIRGEGGVVIVPPTSHNDSTYRWDRDINDDRTNLRAPPEWLLNILNDNASGRDRTPLSAEQQQQQQQDSMEEDDEEEDVDGIVASRIKACLALHGDTSSALDKVKTGPEGRMFVYRVFGPRTCAHGNMHSGRNNFCVLVRGQALLYSCNSAECGDLPPRPIGHLTFEDGVMGSTMVRVDPFDKSVYACLTMKFMERNMMDTDLGGSNVFAAMYRSCARVVYSQAKLAFMVWDGKRYLADPKGDRVRLVCAHQLSGAYRRFKFSLEEMLAAEEDPHAQKQLKDRIKSIPNWTKASNIKSCMEFLRATMTRDGFDESLGANKDVLNCSNGVIDLRTGSLHKHSTRYACDSVIDSVYVGADKSTPVIDAFMGDIFNGDKEVIEYVRRLLGYSITGHVSAQLLVIFHGTGANGKGVLASMLSQLLGDYYVAMQKSCVVKGDGQRGASAGGASPHLAELKGKRIGIVDESAKDERLDAATVKLCTGGGEINARFLYGQNFTFKPTHQTILMTNHKPDIDADDQAIARRLVLIPFLNQYKTPEKYDPANPHHRKRDDTLLERLLVPEATSEFLSWLVSGSVRWYAEGLGETPELLKASIREYYAENDVLGGFVGDSCVVSDDKRVSTILFKSVLEQNTGVRMTIKDLIQQMKARGFEKKASRVGGEIKQCFFGIGLKDSDDMMDS